jgi:predicted RNA-binding protein (virulence factor B family)
LRKEAFARSKVAFERAKGHLLEAKRLPLDAQELTRLTQKRH